MAVTNPDDPINPVETPEAAEVEDGQASFEPVPQNGLSKREYFAAEAMKGLLANDPTATGLTDTAVVKSGELIRSLNTDT